MKSCPVDNICGRQRREILVVGCKSSEAKRYVVNAKQRRQAHKPQTQMCISQFFHVLQLCSHCVIPMPHLSHTSAKKSSYPSRTDGLLSRTRSRPNPLSHHQHRRVELEHDESKTTISPFCANQPQTAARSNSKVMLQEVKKKPPQGVSDDDTK